jgi:signal transduction histidine kinase/CheY-like chemotaxis protein/purine-cytosine permease-like protein
MDDLRQQRIFNIRRDYNSWVANETLEDYALRFAPRSFRKWSEFRVANTAFGSISFLVLEAIGGSLTVTYGFSNACMAILAVGLVIFLTSFPIAYYAAKYNIDMDLLTRGAGFGYIGSTLTSLIYASFTFTLFALEASIMSLALELYFQIPLAFAHLISAVVVIPLVTYGITNINRLQLWTQPVWLFLLALPYGAVLFKEHSALPELLAFAGNDRDGGKFAWLSFGAASTVAFAMIAQIGEQVDFLRFLPEKTQANRVRWWSAVIVAGPGWIVFGVARQLGGAFLAFLAIRAGVGVAHAYEPTQMFLMAYRYLTNNSALAFTATVLLVVVSQIKINVTNAYAGSLAWSNFFSRLTHSHPGRVVWLVFNVAIALLLMELGVFSALERVLGLFSNVAIAWIGALVADLVVNKPLGLSPSYVEFKRAYLHDINPVGVFSTSIASAISIAAYLGLLGDTAQAFSAFIALCIAFALAPLIAKLTNGRYYLARDRTLWVDSSPTDQCCICGNRFEAEDNAYCPAYQGNICSLCCTLDARCRDACKPQARLEDQLQALANRFLPKYFSPQLKLRLLQFMLLYALLAGLTGVFVGVIYYQDLLAITPGEHYYSTLLYDNFIKVYSCLMIFLGLGTWWLILNNESRQVAQEESNRQTLLLLKEIEEHRKTDAKLQHAKDVADRANLAKSRFLIDMSHEIRTPLNSILGYAQILRKDASVPPNRRDSAAIIQNSGEHLSRLIEDILDIARIEARKFDMKRVPIDFHAAIEQMVRMFKPLAESKGLTFRCQVCDHLPRHVRGDENRLGQILINLLANAVKFTSQGEVVLHVEYSSQVAVFKIIDSGEGIPAHQLEDIFQPFTRLDNPRGNAVAGSGLGLTISKILTEVMGGELRVDSKPQHGSTFTVRLFLPELHDIAAPLVHQDIISYRGKRRTVLIADDQHEQRTLLRSMLAPLGFVICEASSGDDCLELAQLHKPDLLLLDLVMTGIDGLEVTRRLRTNSVTAPIIIVSANAYQTHRHLAIAAGCDNFIAKPLQLDELLRKIKLHLSLDWVYAGEEFNEDDEEIEEPMQIPPSTLLGPLAEYARIGDLHGLNDKLHALAQSQPNYAAFVTHLQTLSKDFRLADIKRLLTKS